MAMRFSADEVLEMAVELERRGIAFYENLSKKTSDQKSREIFIFLGEEEKKHLEYFQKNQR
jgi:rubrerythrin